MRLADFYLDPFTFVGYRNNQLPRLIQILIIHKFHKIGDGLGHLWGKSKARNEDNSVLQNSETNKGIAWQTTVKNAFKVMFTLYRMALASARKPYLEGLLFTHKNGDFGAISVTEPRGVSL